MEHQQYSNIQLHFLPRDSAACITTAHSRASVALVTWWLGDTQHLNHHATYLYLTPKIHHTLSRNGRPSRQVLSPASSRRSAYPCVDISETRHNAKDYSRAIQACYDTRYGEDIERVLHEHEQEQSSDRKHG